MALTSKNNIINLFLVFFLVMVFAGSASAACNFQADTLLSPNGGEYWSGTKAITWDPAVCDGGEGVNAKYKTGGCTDDPNDYTLIATCTNIVASSGDCSWDTTTVADASTYCIMLEQNGAPGNNDRSDSVFTIDNTPPVIASAITRDLNATGTVNAIDVTVTEATSGMLNGSCTSVGWGSNIGAITDCEILDDTTLRLTLTGATPEDTTITPTITYTHVAGSNTRDAAGNELEEEAGELTVDGAGPAPISAVYKDDSGNGQVDRIEVTFSEAIASYTHDNNAWAFANDAAFGFEVTAGSEAGAVVTLTVTANAGVTGSDVKPQIRLVDGSDVEDAEGNTPEEQIAYVDIEDEASPVLVEAFYFKSDLSSGSVDRISLIFSEKVDWDGADLDQFVIANEDLTDFATGGEAEGLIGVFDNTISLITRGTINLTGVGTGTQPTIAYVESGIAANHVKDLSGNELENFPAVTLEDEAVPIILSIETRDLDSDGYIDAVLITFSEEIDDTTVVDPASDEFNVVGYSGETFVAANNCAGGIRSGNSDYICLTFTEGDDPDTNATPDVIYTPIETLEDLAGNKLAGVTFTTTEDGAGPAIVSARTLTTTTFEIVFSEVVDRSSISDGNLEYNNTTAGVWTAIPDANIAPHDANLNTYVVTVGNAFASDEDDAEVRFNDADVVDDLEGNGNTQTDAVVIADGIAPTVSTLVTDIALVSGAADTIQVTVTFDEDMNTDVNASITFSDGNLASNDDGTWDTDRIWIETFTHALIVEEEIDDIDVIVNDAQDAAGNVMAQYTEADVFDIDTEKPTVLTVNATAVDPIYEGSLTQTVVVEFSEEMSVAPKITFSAGGWTSNADGAWTVANTEWTETFDHNGVEQEVTGVGVIVEDAEDDAGNVMVPDSTTGAGQFDIDTLKPTVVSATASPDPAKAGLVTITIVFSETMNTGIDPTVEVTGLETDPYAVVKTSFDNNTWIGTFTLSDENEEETATISIDAVAEDLAGNVMLADATNTFEVKTTGPEISDVVVFPAVIRSGETIFVTANLTDTSAVTAFVIFSNNPGVEVAMTGPNDQNRFVWTGPFTVASDGIYGVLVKGYDAALNEVFAQEVNFVVDENAITVEYLYGRVTDLNADMIAAQADIAALQAAMIVAEGRIDDLNADMIAAQADIAAAEGKIDDLNADMIAAQADIVALQAAMIVAEGRIDDLNADMIAAQADILTLDGRITDAEADILTLDGRIDDLNADMIAAQADILTLDGNVDLLDGRLTTVETNLGNLRAEFDAYTAFRLIDTTIVSQTGPTVTVSFDLSDDGRVVITNLMSGEEVIDDVAKTSFTAEFDTNAGLNVFKVVYTHDDLNFSKESFIFVDTTILSPGFTFPRGYMFTDKVEEGWISKYKLDTLVPAVFSDTVDLNAFLNSTEGLAAERLEVNDVNTVHIYDGTKWVTVVNDDVPGAEDGYTFSTWSLYEFVKPLNYFVFELRETSLNKNIRHSTVGPV